MKIVNKFVTTYETKTADIMMRIIDFYHRHEIIELVIYYLKSI